jgi:hypothetical protein
MVHSFLEKPNIKLPNFRSKLRKPDEADAYRRLPAFMPVIAKRRLLWHWLSHRLQAKKRCRIYR